MGGLNQNQVDYRGYLFGLTGCGSKGIGAQDTDHFYLFLFLIVK